MEQTEISKKLVRIEESIDNLIHLRDRLLNSNTAGHIQSIRLQINSLTNRIKSNIHSIKSLLTAPVHKVMIYEVDSNCHTQTTTIYMANATEEEICKYFKLQEILFGKHIEILEIKRCLSEIIK